VTNYGYFVIECYVKYYRLLLKLHVPVMIKQEEGLIPTRYGAHLIEVDPVVVVYGLR
jgi:hypothetical protein